MTRPHLTNSHFRKEVLCMKRLFLELIDYNIHEINTTWWKQIMALFLKSGVPFEIRCWREETEILEKALRFGRISLEQSTRYERSVKGILTDQMIHMLLEQPKPEDDEQMTEFFTINIGSNFCSAHYGLELYMDDLSDTQIQQIHKIITPIQSYFSYEILDMESGN